MVCKADSVDSRISQIYIAGAHVDFASKNHASFGMLAFFHFTEQTQVFFDRTVSIGRVLAGSMKGTAVFFHFLSRLFINVGITGFNKMLGNVIHIVEVVGCEVVIAFFVIFPIESKPIDGTKNGINVFLIFFYRVGVVKTHMASTIELLCKSEVQANTFSMSDMQITVWFRRKTESDFGFIDGAFHLFCIGSWPTAPVSWIVGAFL